MHGSGWNKGSSKCCPCAVLRYILGSRLTMNKTLHIILVVVGMGILANILFAGSGQPVDIPALISGGALVIDVRTKSEFDSGHIAGAIHIPYDVIDRQIAALAKKKEQAIIVYCHSGARSAHAMKTLVKLGYTQVVNGGGLRQMKKSLGK